MKVTKNSTSTKGCFSRCIASSQANCRSLVSAGLGGVCGSVRLLDPEQRQDGRPADEVAEGDELLGGEVAVGELGAEEQRHQRSDVECPEDQRLLPLGEAQAGQVAEDQRQPRPPDEELQEH